MNSVLRESVGKIQLHVALAWEKFENGIAIDPFSPGLRINPYPKYLALRERSPVHYSRVTKTWVLTRHADVDAVLRDHKRFSNDDRNASNARFAPDITENRSMLRLDRPDHSRIREAVGPVFAKMSIEKLRPQIEQKADELFEKLGDKFDVLGDLAVQLPAMVVGDLVGVPREDLHLFEKWGNDAAALLAPSFDGENSRRSNYRRLRLEQTGYFSDLIEQRIVCPREDLISGLVAPMGSPNGLTHDEIVSMAMLIMTAGTLTTQNLIGNGLYSLLKNPDQLQMLRKNPLLINRAIQEFLRFESPSQIDWRTALEDVVIGGKHINKGAVLMLVIGAANRDPEEFSEPDKLDIKREKLNHVSFGRGIHSCIGAHLALLQAQVVFQKILERFSEIRLDGEPEFADHIVFRGLKSLNVSVSRAPIYLG